jgi:hypothetical protein
VDPVGLEGAVAAPALGARTVARTVGRVTGSLLGTSLAAAVAGRLNDAADAIVPGPAADGALAMSAGSGDVAVAEAAATGVAGFEARRAPATMSVATAVSATPPPISLLRDGERAVRRSVTTETLVSEPSSPGIGGSTIAAA